MFNTIRPPGTCLQYHTGLTGRIETFNFNEGNGLHLNNQQYSTCIRAAAGFCCVNYQICPDQAETIAASDAVPGFSLDGKTTDVFADAECVTQDQDYIAIPQSCKLS